METRFIEQSENLYRFTINCYYEEKDEIFGEIKNWLRDNTMVDYDANSPGYINGFEMPNIMVILLHCDEDAMAFKLRWI